MQHCILLGAPVQEGASQRGCAMGPEALRTAKLAEALMELGHTVEDRGDVSPRVVPVVPHDNKAIHNLDEVSAWIDALAGQAHNAANSGTPIFLGGDHSMAAGTVSGVARAAAEAGKPLFVLWLDAHPDFHSLSSTGSGNLHGTPVAYFTGQSGFDGFFPTVTHPVDPANIFMMGLRSVDPAENAAMAKTDITLHDMRAMDEFGIVAPLREFLARVKAADGWLHVSLDVDFIDPSIAPGVGTTVPGGATFREAHLILEMAQESGLVGSMDLVELNPFLDERGRTAKLLVDLTASLFGRRIIDRKTKSF
ncbi:arginase [Amylibacter ulvae]|uniref:Arginase n=1 Tax=Paramylibacter ulvae TaxID=1651968 RepID=A0ABQ3D455_9RHOB|nr:arginase [Amylibacter ulvae]GHA55862.1 arginase [Amylibacter ulvae]